MTCPSRKFCETVVEAGGNGAEGEGGVATGKEEEREEEGGESLYLDAPFYAFILPSSIILL
jgi:hypothetical protein